MSDPKKDLDAVIASHNAIATLVATYGVLLTTKEREGVIMQAQWQAQCDVARNQLKEEARSHAEDVSSMSDKLDEAKKRIEHLVREVQQLTKSRDAVAKNLVKEKERYKSVDLRRIRLLSRLGDARAMILSPNEAQDVEFIDVEIEKQIRESAAEDEETPF